MLLTRTECLHCDRCVPSAKFPAIIDPSRPEYAKYQGCFPELKASCEERQCLTTGDVTSGRCAGCERCPVVQGTPTCSKGLKTYCLNVCETIEDLLDNEDVCHLCDACVPGGDEFRKLRPHPFPTVNRDKDCRISFGYVPGTEVCDPLPLSALTPPPAEGFDRNWVMDTDIAKCRRGAQKRMKCLPKPTAVIRQQQQLALPGQTSQTGQNGQTAQPGQNGQPVNNMSQCPANLVATCRKPGNECMTTGDVESKGWCKACGPCVVPGGVTCSANQRAYCNKNCATAAAKATKACQTSCASC